jgi:hypothetical protein
MKLFIAFLTLSFLSGIILRRARPVQRALYLLALCLLVSFAYFFLHQL